MELAKAMKMKVMVAEEKATFSKMLVCEAREWALEVEQEFQ